MNAQRREGGEEEKSLIGILVQITSRRVWVYSSIISDLLLLWLVAYTCVNSDFYFYNELFCKKYPRRYGGDLQINHLHFNWRNNCQMQKYHQGRNLCKK